MVDNQRPQSTASLLLWLAGYVLAFCVAAGVLIRLFPAHAVWTVAVAGYLFIALLAFRIGWEWALPGTPPEGRRVVKSFPCVFLAFALANLFDDLIHSHQLNWIVFVCYCVYFAAAIYPPFFLGRLISRHRQERSAQPPNR